MLTIIRGLRVLVGLVGVWQAIGLLPVFTNWLPNLQYVTGGMWGLAVVKVSIMLFCGGIYYWLGTVKKRIAETGAGSSDGRIIIFSMLALLAVGIVISIGLPAFSPRERGSEGAAVPSVHPIASDPESTSPEQEESLPELDCEPTGEPPKWVGGKKLTPVKCKGM
ncbi:MAG: hypothetical protein KDI78_04155 [Xanthomonadales bacterium]|nr:hypothetical protein [Xanthomonadales bacterium]